MYLCSNMKFGVVIFPGSNCDQDLIKVLQTYTSEPVLKLWHKDTDLQGCTHIFVPGGFSYGDYLRSGAIAKLSPIMGAVADHASKGGFVLGICNGFQILCESGLLPGALLRNTNMKFNCKNVHLKAGNTDLVATRKIDGNDVLCVPIAHVKVASTAMNKRWRRLSRTDKCSSVTAMKTGTLPTRPTPTVP